MKVLRLPPPAGGLQMLARMREESSRELRHHAHSLDEVRGSTELRPATIELYLRLWNGEDASALAEQPDAGFGRAFTDLRGNFSRLVSEQNHMRTTLSEEIGRRQREAEEWRQQALALRDENGRLKGRAEYRMGERLRRVWRRLRRRSPQA